MDASQSLSLKDFELLTANNPYTKNMVRRELASTYEEFVDIFYDDLDLAISHLETNPQMHDGDGEDKLTDFIVSQLRMSAYQASHGTTGGGSKDFTVLGRRQGWTWIGEAKIFHSISNLDEGFLQLTTRYRNSDPTKNSGGLIAYIFRPQSSKLLATWEAHLSTLQMDGFSSESCARKPGLAFYTTHNLKATGLPCKVRHVAVSLFFEPLDKSGRAAAKYQKTATP